MVFGIGIEPSQKLVPAITSVHSLCAFTSTHLICRAPAYLPAPFNWQPPLGNSPFSSAVRLLIPPHRSPAGGGRQHSAILSFSTGAVMSSGQTLALFCLTWKYIPFYLFLPNWFYFWTHPPLAHNNYIVPLQMSSLHSVSLLHSLLRCIYENKKVFCIKVTHWVAPIAKASICTDSTLLPLGMELEI